jgi:hypothetical protein
VTVEEPNPWRFRVLGLVHLGRAKGPAKTAPERASLDDFRAYLQ